MDLCRWLSFLNSLLLQNYWSLIPPVPSFALDMWLFPGFILSLRLFFPSPLCEFLFPLFWTHCFFLPHALWSVSLKLLKNTTILMLWNPTFWSQVPKSSLNLRLTEYFAYLHGKSHWLFKLFSNLNSPHTPISTPSFFNKLLLSPSSRSKFLLDIQSKHLGDKVLLWLSTLIVALKK